MKIEKRSISNSKYPFLIESKSSVLWPDVRRKREGAGGAGSFGPAQFAGTELYDSSIN